MLPDEVENGKMNFSIMGLAPWGFMLCLSEIVLVIFFIIGIAKESFPIVLWSFGQFFFIFFVAAWFTRDRGIDGY